MNAEELLEHLKGSVLTIGESFTKPDADWQPIAFSVGPESIGPMALGIAFFDSPETKDKLVEILKHHIISEKIEVFGLVLGSWRVKVKRKAGRNPEELLHVPPSQHPDKEEQLMITVFTAEKVLVATARVERHPDKPPTLSAWEKSPDSLEGSLVEPFREALKIAKRAE